MIRVVIICVMVFLSEIIMALQPSNMELKTQPLKPEKVSLHGYDWSGEIPTKAEIVVSNPFGDIRARNHGENKVFLHAVYQKIGDHPLEPDFVIKKKSGKWHIEVRYNKGVYYKSGKLRARTDLALLFPEHVKIHARTDFGMIKVDRSASDVIAKSNSGIIKLTTTGQFKAGSDSGEIALKLRGFKQKGQSTAHTDTGKITAAIFSDADLLLSAKTRGEITQNNNKVKNKSYTYRYGSQLARVDLKSEKGNIELKIVKPPELVKSVNPISVKQDLRNLPKEKPWQPGDSVVDREDKINHNTNATKDKK